jgi:hypothetical protein
MNSVIGTPEERHRMSTYFRGPSLFTHVMIVSIALGIGVPLCAELLQSRLLALSIGVVAALVYGLGAVLWGSGGRRHRDGA